MKVYSIIALMLTALIAGPALAADILPPQTHDCGRNMSQLSGQIRSKFKGVFSADYVNRFMGAWKSKTGNFLTQVKFNIDPEKKFVFGGEPYEICPQYDGSFYMYQVSDPTQSGYFRLQGKKGAKLYGGRGNLQAAEDDYLHDSAGVELATNPEREN